MNLDTNFLTWIISTALFLITGYISLIRRIDNNKKEQELKDVEIKGALNSIQNQLKSMSDLMQIQIDQIKDEIKEFKEWKKEKV